MKPLLKVSDAVASYGAVRALKGISFEVGEGEIVTLVGANGAGKTTTLRTISGLLHPQSGSIQFAGQRIDRLAPEAVVKLGISHVPEGRRIFPGLSVMDNLRLGTVGRDRSDRGSVDEDLQHVFRTFPILEEFRSRLGWMLSGGQQQMLAIGRGLMARPKLLLLDEPSLGLAPVIVQQVFEVIREINRAGTAILLVEQNAYMALQVAARGYVLETGRIVLADEARALLQDERMQRAYLGAHVEAAS
jgi:branched-chain amino acid transport system ATP-binding protein